MDPHDKEQTEAFTAGRVARFIVGVVVFGVLMGIRTDFESHWTRSLVAGIAAAALAIGILPLRRHKQ
jgi:hypothetical protein